MESGATNWIEERDGQSMQQQILLRFTSKNLLALNPATHVPLIQICMQPGTHTYTCKHKTHVVSVVDTSCLMPTISGL